MTDDHFGELRSLLQQPPCDQTWAQVLAWAQTHPRELKREDVALYLGDMLKAWPTTVERFVTTPLLDLLLRRPEVSHPWLASTSGLVFIFGELNVYDPASEKRLKKLSAWINAIYIHEVRLGYEDAEFVFPEMAAAHLSRGQHWRGLRRLSICADWLDDDGVESLGKLNFPKLEALELKGAVYISPDGVDAFRKGKKLPKHILNMELNPKRTIWDSEMECWE
jgi:hypothetical protein